MASDRPEPTARFSWLSDALANQSPAGADGSLEGLSGNRVLEVLRAAARRAESLDNACYVEVGVFRGLTLMTVAAAAPGLRCFGIDNFSQFDTDGTNQSIVLARRADLGLDNATLIDLDYEVALESLGEHIAADRVALYFFDGPHDYRAQLMGLLRAVPYLHDEAVIIVDDANYAHVRQANADFLALNPDFKLAFEAYTSDHPMTTGSPDAEAQRTWWNGINVLVRDPDGILDAAVPHAGPAFEWFTDLERTLRGEPLREFVPNLLRWADRAVELPVHRFAIKSRFLWKGIRAAAQKHSGRGRWVVDTEHLPPTCLNAALRGS